jgi:urea transport system substrate-binding protein
MNIDRRQFLGTAAALAGASALGGPAFAADPIKVGSLHDLSGGLDIYGKPMVDVFTFAIEEANAAGGLLGRPVQLINYDTQSSMQLYIPIFTTDTFLHARPPFRRSTSRSID